MTRNQVIKYGRVLVAVSAAAAGSAMAALPAEVTAGIADAQADGQTLGYALLTMAIIVGVVFWLKRKG